MRNKHYARGVLSVEAAFVLPVIIIGAMMFLELANIGLTIDMGNTALERTIQQFRQTGTEGANASTMEPLIRQRMASASHGYLREANIDVINIERFNSLDEMGGDQKLNEKNGAQDAAKNDAQVPIWRITVDIRKNFVSPIPRLLAMDNPTFRYRYQQLLGYLPTKSAP